jgi:NADPH:quinone reductase-like Zn-dependent oxidoreductase
MTQYHVLEFDRIGDRMGLVFGAARFPDLGEHEVLYKVFAFGLNQADLLLMEGRHYVTSDLPVRIGYEASGEVIEVDALAERGIIYVHGGLSGSNQLSFPVLSLVRRGAGLYGFSLINELRSPEAMKRGRDFVLDAIARGALPGPTIDRVFPFSEAQSAYARMRSGAQRGKIIVAIEPA